MTLQYGKFLTRTRKSVSKTSSITKSFRRIVVELCYNLKYAKLQKKKEITDRENEFKIVTQNQKKKNCLTREIRSSVNILHFPFANTLILLETSRCSMLTTVGEVWHIQRRHVSVQGYPGKLSHET